MYSDGREGEISTSLTEEHTSTNIDAIEIRSYTKLYIVAVGVEWAAGTYVSK
jgi:hypothetical protein